MTTSKKNKECTHYDDDDGDGGVGDDEYDVFSFTFFFSQINPAGQVLKIKIKKKERRRMHSLNNVFLPSQE